jgi:hypothetical protein
MVRDTLEPELDVVLDRAHATTASVLVLVLTPAGELAAYRGPADLATAVRLAHILDLCTASPIQATIQHILLNSELGHTCYLAPLPHGWTYILADQLACSNARLGELASTVRQTSAALARVLQSRPAAPVRISAVAAHWLVSTTPALLGTAS